MSGPARRYSPLVILAALLGCGDPAEVSLLRLSFTPPTGFAVVGRPAGFNLDATASGPVQFTSVGEPLPDGLTLDATTGRVTGAPTVAALLGGNGTGLWQGITIRAEADGEVVETPTFAIQVIGTTLPEPYAYMSFDDEVLDDQVGSGSAFPVGERVVGGREGVVGEAVRVSGSDTYIRYPAGLSSTLNGAPGFTYSAHLRTGSAASMFFSLSDGHEGWSRAYAGLAGGAITFGGRSRDHTDEEFLSVTGSTAVNDGEYHSVVGVLDLEGDRIALFVDGVLDAELAPGFALPAFEALTPADQNVIGHITGLAAVDAAPDITHDEVALWDRPLDAYQAATLAWLGRVGISVADWLDR